MRIGVDVGGTTVKVGFIDDYKIVDRIVVETKKETLFDDVLRETKKYVELKKYDVDGIGFGLPGHVLGTYIDKLPNVGIASDCTECGMCVEECPQHIDIPKVMKDVVKTFETEYYGFVD